MTTAQKSSARMVHVQHCHIPRILDIVDETKHVEVSKKSLAKFLRQEDQRGYAYYYKATLIGYVLFHELPDEFVIADFAVHPEFQRRGVGRHIINELKRRVRYGSRNAIIVDVSETLDGVHLFLKACGFRAEKLIRGPVDGRDSYRFAYRYQEPVESAA